MQIEELLALKDFKTSLLATKERLDTAFDKSITALSGGAIGLSLVFLQRIQELGAPATGRSFSWMIGAWAAWAGAIVASVLSSTLSIDAYRRGLDDCDFILNRWGDEKSRSLALSRLMQLSKSRSAKWAHRLTAIAGPLFAFGVVSLLVFVAQAF